MRESSIPGSREIERLLAPARKLIAALQRSDAITSGDVEVAISKVTELASALLRVVRVGVWRFEQDPERIVCVDLFESPGGLHSGGAAVLATQAPRYFEAVREARSIVANDARSDSRTSELDASYLTPLGIVSMLDVPVLVRGQLAGVLCFEHIGEPRRFSFSEELVACTLADYVAMVLGAAENVAQARELATYRDELERRVESRTRELRLAEQELRIMFEASPIGLLVTRARDYAVVAATRRAMELFEQPFETLGEARSIDFWVDVADRTRAVELLKEKKHVEGFRARFKTAGKRIFWGEVNLRMIERDGEPCFLAGVRDVSDQVHAEAVVRQSRDTLRTLFDAAPLPMVLTGLDDGLIRQVNDKAATMFGATVDEILGRCAPDFYYDPEQRNGFLEALRRDGRVDGFTVQLKNARGEPFWVLMSANVIDIEGERCFFVGFADVDEQKKLEARLDQLASTDALTGVYNRRRLFELAAAEVERSERYGHPLSVALLDVDHFKRLNDRYGHAAGDEALRELVRIVSTVLRKVDVLARYGGEEFVILFPETDQAGALRVAERVRAAVAEQSGARGAPPLTVSVGLTQRRAGESVDPIFRRADAALYEAKDGGRNAVRVGHTLPPVGD